MLFQRRDIEQYTDSLAAYLPKDELFASKSIQTSNLRKLLRGMSGELFRANGLLRDYNSELLPDETNKFLSEWESAVGIPDSCFAGTGTNDERRRDILVKLASLGVQTTEDFIELAALFGITIRVTPGFQEITFPLIFPVLMFTTEADARFTIVIEFTEQAPTRFPFTFPILFGSGELLILECLFTKLKPANCDIVFQQA